MHTVISSQSTSSPLNAAATSLAVAGTLIAAHLVTPRNALTGPLPSHLSHVMSAHNSINMTLHDNYVEPSASPKR
jgi:hypothetical protein